MDKKILKNVFYYGIGDFIVTGVTAFLFIPLYIKYLTVEEYGIFNILNNNTTLFSYIFQFGIISAFSRIYFLRKTENRHNGYIWNVIYLHLALALTFFLFIYFFQKPLFENLSPSVKEQRLLFYPAAIAFLTFLPALYYIYLRVEEKAAAFVGYQLVNVAIISTLIVSSLWFYTLNLYSILISFVVTNLIIWTVILFKFSKVYLFQFNLKDIKETIHFAFPIFISYIAYFFISKYGIIILQKHVSIQDIAKFSLAQQISAIPSLITIAISKAVQPYLFSSNSTQELKIKAQSFDYNYKLIMTWVVGCMIFLTDVVFTYLLPASYYEANTVTKYLLFIILIYNFSIVENSILLYYMKSKIILAITVIGSIVNVLLSNILVYKFSINGVLIAMLTAFSINFLLDVFFSSKHIKLKYDIKTLTCCFLIILTFLFISSSSFVPFYQLHKISFAVLSFTLLTTFVVLYLKKTNNDFSPKASN